MGLVSLYDSMIIFSCSYVAANGIISFFLWLSSHSIKNLPAMRETWIQSLGWEDLLEKGMATHSNILARKIPWTEEPGRLQSVESQEVGHD